ncbi:hypothetical protein MJO47_14650 [Desulfuromonas sp. KJ2020]|uniref:hypothetical protein n=1 Tax=Desulfuromonas sp. KJ2020 TaxID=2919173 RepID=UPI0020A7D21B|nr:hypothetical protein [Desulfuromonas sp. KJ2020]MCP3178342.1 hypothetical protein [Desulfuromonas sp. KJ2020]
MEPQENDDFFDKIMLFFANWSRPIAEEFFKLLQWLFLMSALSFLSIKSDNYIFDALLILSAIMVWFYMMFGYNSLWHNKFHTQFAKKEDSIKSMLKNHAVWSCGALLIIIFTSIFFCIAKVFGKEAALLLYK